MKKTGYQMKDENKIKRLEKRIEELEERLSDESERRIFYDKLVAWFLFGLFLLILILTFPTIVSWYGSLSEYNKTALHGALGGLLLFFFLGLTCIQRD